MSHRAGRPVLVTGATGFVGRALVRALEREGIPLTLAVRRPGPERTGARLVPVGDLGGDVDWRGALDGVEAVVHLAAHVHVAPERAEAEAERFDAVNRRASLRLFEAAAEQGVSRFVHVSSTAVLGTVSPTGRPFDDASPPDPRTPYARSKLAAEIGLRDKAAGSATELVILRPPLVSGPEVGGNLASLIRLAATPLPLPLGGLQNRRTLLALDNLVAAIRAVLAHPGPIGPGQPYGLGDAEPVSTSDIVRHLREGLGRPARLLPAPRRLARVAAAWLGRPGLHDRLFGDMWVDSSRFRRDFGHADVMTTAESLRAAAGAQAAAGLVSRPMSPASRRTNRA